MDGTQNNTLDDPNVAAVAQSASATSRDLLLGRAEQACKECRRRKAKCDRAIPICGLCSKYAALCLYEKHYRTPLTRKYGNLACPPIVSHGFEWDEQYIVEKQTSISGWSPDRSTSEGVEEDPAVVDGMASLTIGESEGGYLGVASGAAVLRLIDPRAASTSGPLKAASKLRPARILSNDGTWPELLCDQPDPNRHIVDSMIDAYFGLYHINYPIVHEPTFRAQYSELIERPNGNCWKFLAYVIAAVGVFTTSNTAETADLALFAQAKSLMHLSYLESGNLTLIQALGLMSNYLQRKDMPNSGYNYLGLATRMAMGLGLHKEFQGWSIPPLKMEIRRRVWWCLAVFDIGATITYGRPVSWPAGGVDVALPLNIDDRLLTAGSTRYPEPSLEFTIYSTVHALSSFYLASMPIYARIISKPFPSAKELVELDDRRISRWCSDLPPFFAKDYQVPQKYRTSQAIVMWKCQNFRIIMYRPFVIRRLLQSRQDRHEPSLEESQAYDRCLHEALSTIESVNNFWTYQKHSRLGAWYALYFLFQAALIPCICLRSESAKDTTSENTDNWLQQIRVTLQVMKSIGTILPTSEKCHDVIWWLCRDSFHEDSSPSAALNPDLEPINESPHTQMNNVYSMMWSHAPTLDADTTMTMQDDAWMAFLEEENNNPYI
ncbi:hypothetical protein OIDMADRAFT_173803 [Oidiodendron maius Zn]|uniref:Zn(2)-C6 fungal-type domain-containing protein n=1 Tax=Oidiodendron maius (strain Zn) TaxID=913774 RepID=A0A0C3G994_OIDMZ|nr:hypothetical protein OIDMADRAFT_173803 [Oidiodendron maius Zn]